jgi:hypothetical protein
VAAFAMRAATGTNRSLRLPLRGGDRCRGRVLFFLGIRPSIFRRLH